MSIAYSSVSLPHANAKKRQSIYYQCAIIIQYP